MCGVCDGEWVREQAGGEGAGRGNEGAGERERDRIRRGRIELGGQ